MTVKVTVMKANEPDRDRMSKGAMSFLSTVVNGFFLKMPTKIDAPIRVMDVLRKLISATLIP